MALSAGKGDLRRCPCLTMPNTLAHIGAQGLATRLALRDADPKWIYLGCVVPDVPWILQRAVLVAVPAVDAVTLRSYVDIQASLLGCLLLCGALAVLAVAPGRMFFVLSLNAFLHLLLDACQTKWGNGVHLLAPFSWTLTNWGLFWPESLITYVLTGLGLACVVWYWRTSLRRRPRTGHLTMRRLALLMTLLAAYYALPLLFLHGPIAADNHYLETLRTLHDRAGRYVEFDRARCVPVGDAAYCGGLRMNGLALERPATVSIRGVFTADREIRVIESHAHWRGFRDSASYIGLALIVMVWIQAWMRPSTIRRKSIGAHR